MDKAASDKRNYMATIHAFNDLPSEYKTLSSNKNSINIKLKNFMRSNYDVSNY